MEKDNAEKQTSEESYTGGYRSLKKIKQLVKDARDIHKDSTVRLMFQDEAGFGRINKPKYCWCKRGYVRLCRATTSENIDMCMAPLSRLTAMVVF